MYPSALIIHCKESYFQELMNLGLDPNYDDGEYNVVVDDVPNEIFSVDYSEDEFIEPHPRDVAICEHYGIDINQVNCIEEV